MFTTLDKVYFALCGIIMAAAMIWVTHVYFEYRVSGMARADYRDIPTWSWKPVFNKLNGDDHG
jgi:hypothetical protein